jgi:hypothetical protein
MKYTDLHRIGAHNSGGEDTELAWLTPQDRALLHALGGSGSVDPDTGLQHFNTDDNTGDAPSGPSEGGWSDTDFEDQSHMNDYSTGRNAERSDNDPFGSTLDWGKNDYQGVVQDGRGNAVLDSFGNPVGYGGYYSGSDAYGNNGRGYDALAQGNMWSTTNNGWMSRDEVNQAIFNDINAALGTNYNINTHFLNNDFTVSAFNPHGVANTTFDENDAATTGGVANNVGRTDALGNTVSRGDMPGILSQDIAQWQNDNPGTNALMMLGLFAADPLAALAYSTASNLNSGNVVGALSSAAGAGFGTPAGAVVGALGNLASGREQSAANSVINGTLNSTGNGLGSWMAGQLDATPFEQATASMFGSGLQGGLVNSATGVAGLSNTGSTALSGGNSFYVSGDGETPSTHNTTPAETTVAEAILNPQTLAVSTPNPYNGGWNPREPRTFTGVADAAHYGERRGGQSMYSSINPVRKAQGGRVDYPEQNMHNPLERIRQIGAAQSVDGQDTELAHINPEEAALLEYLGGSGRMDPITGLRHFDDGFGIDDTTANIQALLSGSTPTPTNPSFVFDMPTDYVNNESDDAQQFTSMLPQSVAATNRFLQNPGEWNRTHDGDMGGLDYINAREMVRDMERQNAPAESSKSAWDYVTDAAGGVGAGLAKALGSAAAGVVANPVGLLAAYGQYKASKGAQREARDARDFARQQADPNYQKSLLRQDPLYRNFTINRTPRTQSNTIDPRTYGERGGQQQFNSVNPTVTRTPVALAGGGSPLQRMVQGPGGGQDDLVPAQLSPNEYVMDSDVVAALGDGNPEEGARRLDKMRENVRKHKRGTSAKKIPPKALPPEQYLKRGK